MGRKKNVYGRTDILGDARVCRSTRKAFLALRFYQSFGLKLPHRFSADLRGSVAVLRSE